MSVYTVIGDPHSKPNNRDLTAQLFSMVEELGFPAIWLGDLLDTKEVVRSKCLNDYFRYFKDSKLQHIVLVGNHDWHNLECKEHSLEPLKSLSNVIIVDRPTKIEGIQFLPYIHGADEVRKYLKGGRLLIGHLEIAGFDFGNGHICEEGLSLKDLEGYEKVISGHFHKYQEKGNLIYVGTPFTHTFGESNQEKHIAVLNTEDLTLDYVPTPFPTHITLELNLDEVSDEEAVQTLIKKNSKPGDFLRVVMNGTEEQLIKFDKSKFDGVKFIEKAEQLDAEALDISETSSNEEKFKLWAEAKGIAPDTVKLGIEILKGVAG